MSTPELSILFNEPKTRIYEPGDTVSGSALFIPLFSARLRSLEVSLQGYCYTSSLGANAKVSHTVPFLHLSSTTLEQKYTYIGERYEAPFSFVFPAATDVEHEAGPEKLKPLFNQGPQALPFSVVISARNCVQMIRYVIEVEIFGRKRSVCEETVLFRQPLRTVDELAAIIEHAEDRGTGEHTTDDESYIANEEIHASHHRREHSSDRSSKKEHVPEVLRQPEEHHAVEHHKPEEHHEAEIHEPAKPSHMLELQDLITFDGEDAVPEFGAPLTPLLTETWRSDKAMYLNRAATMRFTDNQDAPELTLHALPMISTHHKGARDRYRLAKNISEGPLRWVFKPWSTPKIIFMPSIYCPATTMIGQDIPFLLAVDTVKNPVWTGHLQETELTLQELTLAVTAHSRTIMQNRPHKRRWGRCLELPYTVLKVVGLSAPINIDGQPVPLVHNFKIRPGTLPSFSTYTLSRGYSIDVFLKFRFGSQSLEWAGSFILDVTGNPAIPPAEGQHMDPLLFVDPKREPQYFFRSHIEAGAAESTSRSNIYPGNPDDVINMPGMQWETGHGRLPRTSFACASGQIRPELTPPKTERTKDSNFSVVGGICGKPTRRYMKDLRFRYDLQA